MVNKRRSSLKNFVVWSIFGLLYLFIVLFYFLLETFRAPFTCAKSSVSPPYMKALNFRCQQSPQVGGIKENL